MSRTRTFAIALVALLVIATVAVLSMLLARGSASEQGVPVERGSIQATVTGLGRVRAAEVLQLSPRVSGTVATIHVQVGDEVPANALLLSLSDRDQADAIEQARRAVAVRTAALNEALNSPTQAQIDVARARLRWATAARQNAQDDYDEVRDEPDAESSDEAVALERAKLDYETAKADFDRVLEGTSEATLQRLRADVADAELSLAQASARLEQTRVYAPVPGTILRIDAREGENIHGFSPVIRMADLGRLEVLAEIDEIDIAQVLVGQAVDVRLDAFPAEMVRGTVSRVHPGTGDTRGVTTYEVVVALDENDLPLRLGMGGSLTITTARVDDALLIPRQAVRRAGRHEVVRVLSSEGVREVVVVTGLSDQVQVQVIEGLSEGQRVLTD